ncbi:hypothetical protein QBC33DRAFT_528099 [Phialemonium atrogriseum]|uniref:Uncharacterized protein n=1 Tax=Phialemonium atrogriseum TaxID=1093897 RepID=A0AAJ0C5D0_9PEZI|nr:uncharacterized protein QBC33DRAFT_528099 [Phialemonium atrogriseum]KAK1770465.1 hypothetical protein QBC33DRAFT_528099 [Phialemonium atrogriseum]
MSAAVTLTSSFLECTPLPTTTVTNTVTSTFTTTYCVTLPAACPTSEWIATYTLLEICTGERDHWTPPAIPPNFGTTTVFCDVCHEKTQVITCPNAAAPTGPTVIGGDGITVTAPDHPGFPQPTQNPAPGPPGNFVPPPQETGAANPDNGGDDSPVVTAGSPPSLKKGLALMAGLALAVGQFLVL